jgi:hypothetical protein
VGKTSMIKLTTTLINKIQSNLFFSWVCELKFLIKELNFCMNWITLDSINSTFLLGGNYVNSVGDKSK